MSDSKGTKYAALVLFSGFGAALIALLFTDWRYAVTAMIVGLVATVAIGVFTDDR